MAKFYGAVGYAVSDVNEATGVVREYIQERNYYGDVIKTYRKFDNGADVNGSVTPNNSISILADAYARQHFFAMRYVEWMGAKWVITGAEVQEHRIILTLGGVYHGPESWSARNPV